VVPKCSGHCGFARLGWVCCHAAVGRHLDNRSAKRGFAPKRRIKQPTTGAFANSALANSASTQSGTR
jgi:hypothetical protein